jgi:protein-disulfide isomerase
MQYVVRRIVVVAVGLVAALGGVVSAQSSQQTNQAVLEELRQIRQLLEKLAGAPKGAPTPETNRRVQLSIAGSYSIGNPDAPLTMVEFTDLQCPFCRHFYMTTFERLKTAYIDTNKLRYVSRDFPLEAIHPMALSAARAARCAGAQGRFWEMRHAILKNNSTLTYESFLGDAATLQLDPSRFRTCVDAADAFSTEIAHDMADAERVGVTGTPAFVIGRTSGTTLDGILVMGAQPYEAFDAQLKAFLPGAGIN